MTSLVLFQDLEMISIAGENPFMGQLTDFVGQGTPVHEEIVSQLLPVKWDIKGSRMVLHRFF